VDFASINEELTGKVRVLFENKFSAPTKQGYVFAIMQGPGGLKLTRIGHAGIGLERGNYSEEILKDYDYALADLKSKTPSGRIIILSGNAGTGKTFLTRSFLMDVPDAMFVIVPPAMVQSIGGPELLPMLLKHKEDYRKKGPTILVLEDADHCLAPRQADNMSSISSILNLGDGIFGSLFDIRILATTNAKRVELDPAIIRAGRLSKQIEIGPMHYDDANKVFHRLLGKDDLNLPKEVKENGMRPMQKVEYTLAEIYKTARDNGWEPVAAKEEDDNLPQPSLFNDMMADMEDVDF
jgi:ATP-dependent 26S proteasome regulatory subunit